MSSDVIQADYEVVESIAARFGSESERTAETNGRVQQAMRSLQNGGWEGVGSQAFLAEMEDMIFPASTRLIEALAQAESVTLQIKEILQAAEEEASSPFRGNGAGGVGGGTNGVGTVDVSGEAAVGNAPLANNLPENPDDIDEDYWDSLSEEEQKRIHYNRNKYQDSANIPLLESDLVPGEWEKIEGEAMAHNVGEGVSGNSDYRGIGPRAGHQAVYDSNGRLVTTPENRGTYDFAKPGSMAHLNMDVLPWIKWGNSPDDTTTPLQRMTALGLGVAAKGKDMAIDVVDSTVDAVQEAAGKTAGAANNLVDYIKENVGDLFD